MGAHDRNNGGRYYLPPGITNLHPFYKVWAHMKERCNNPNVWAYQFYGAKGITYDPKYESFQAFYDDFFQDWRPGLRIDRKDNLQGYVKSNIQWSTTKESARNRGSIKLTQADADEIRREYELTKCRQGRLAKKWGVTQAQISNILRGLQWKA